jgi:predicted Zn-dependent protease
MWQYAGLLMEHERYAEALPFAEAAARQRPEVAMYAWRYIELLGLVGRHREAEAEARALLARHPGPASHMTMARALAKAGRNREAELYLLIGRQLGAARLAIREVHEEMTNGPQRGPDVMTSAPK